MSYIRDPFYIYPTNNSVVFDSTEVDNDILNTFIYLLSVKDDFELKKRILLGKNALLEAQKNMYYYSVIKRACGFYTEEFTIEEMLNLTKNISSDELSKRISELWDDSEGVNKFTIEKIEFIRSNTKPLTTIDRFNCVF